MTDYFNEFSSVISNKSLPSPADTPYEPSNFIRSKRSSRATTDSFHEEASSPSLAPLAADHQDHGRFNHLDPRRFTPTLHASLVSEILNLRRELDSKNHLVENLETSLSVAKSENETLSQQLGDSTKEVRKAKRQVQQMEQGTYEALEDLVHERDVAKSTADELRVKFENLQKKTRHQDEDAVRTQTIWEDEKERWDNERRQMERRIHVTESRLRAFVDQMAAQQASAEAQPVHVDFTDDGTFQDSALGNESDTGSITTSTAAKHRRNKSSLSLRPDRAHSSLSSRAQVVSPDLYAKPMGNSLADELGIDEEEEDEGEEDGEAGSVMGEDFANEDEALEYPERVKRAESRQSEINGELESKPKRVLGLTTDLPESPVVQNAPSLSAIAAATAVEMHQTKEPPRVIYVDKGYQPSPPPSPVSPVQRDEALQIRDSDTHASLVEDAPLSEAARESASLQDSLLASTGDLAKSPISPPQTPTIGDETWSSAGSPRAAPPVYVAASTQTEVVEPAQTSDPAPVRDSLSPPLFVPSIAIHPPSSRPSTPRTPVLPPGTRNASTQAELPWPSKDASVQTEEIRVDRRLVKLPAHLLPSHLLPSPTLPEPRRTRGTLGPALTEIVTKLPLEDEPQSPPPPPLTMQSPAPSSPEAPRRNSVSAKDIRSLPLKAIPLPKPVLSPIEPPEEKAVGNGPLNRSSVYGVVQPKRDILYYADPHDVSDDSDTDAIPHHADARTLIASTTSLSRAPHGRFGLSEPPKAVPENKEISPDRRPRTADSYVGAPAPSISSARTTSKPQNYSRPSQKRRPSRDLRSRSPSLKSMASSSNSANLLSQVPPYPIPNRSSSRALSKTHSEGSRSPTHDHKHHRSGRSSKGDLRKVRSATAMRNKTGRTSPSKPVRRRRRSPDLTPVVSMAFDDSPAPTKFPIPELPTPLQHPAPTHSVQNSVDTGHPSTVSSAPPPSEDVSLVDAIAATMVGEWMWKYTRKRKSFGLGDDTSKFPIDRNGNVIENAHGIRHKRWVWLSPYERTIMWDTKQPSSGSALLGKKGRKLAIQSVLEVNDLTPLPKDAELTSAFNRSILILTPARALKFTAVTQDRHVFWMTALSFLAQSGQITTQISPVPSGVTHIPVPSLPSVESVPINRYRAPSFARGTVRDSIRLAKGKRPDHLAQAHPSPDGADAPSVPRLYVGTTRHHRNRSNTSPRVTPALGTLRSFSSSVVPSSAASSSAVLHPDFGSINGSTSAPTYHHPQPHPHPLQQHQLPHSVSSSSSQHHHHHHHHPPSAPPTQRSSANTTPTLPMPNFFEAVSTMRMEAFVDPNVRDGVLYVPAPPPPGTALSGPTVRTYHHYHAHHLRGESSLSQSTIDRRRAGYVFDEDGLDPFKGF